MPNELSHAAGRRGDRSGICRRERALFPLPGVGFSQDRIESFFPIRGDEKTRPNRAERSRSSQRGKEEPRFCFYLHQLLLLLLTGADGVSEGAHLRQDGLRLLQLVAIRAVGDLLVDPGGQREESRKKGNLEIKNKETFP